MVDEDEDEDEIEGSPRWRRLSKRMLTERGELKVDFMLAEPKSNVLFTDWSTSLGDAQQLTEFNPPDDISYTGFQAQGHGLSH